MICDITLPYSILFVSLWEGKSEGTRTERALVFYWFQYDIRIVEWCTAVLCMLNDVLRDVYFLMGLCFVALSSFFCVPGVFRKQSFFSWLAYARS